MRLTGLFLLFLLTGSASGEIRNGFDLAGSLVPVNEILPGGPPRDGIPAITNPVFRKVEDTEWLTKKDRVLGIVVNGTAKAYPVKILEWHEVVNDSVGKTHFAVTYCPLCGTGVAFSADIADTWLQFGVSGLLYNSDMLLYDRNSESLWSQLLGKAITGRLKGAELPMLPLTHTTWSDWQADHPDTLVLSRETGYGRDYRTSPYAGYEKNDRILFKVSHKAPSSYHPKERVLGVFLGGRYRAYPYVELSRNGKSRFADRIAGRDVIVHWREEAGSGRITDTDGREIPTISSYWFAWYTFHPGTEVFQAP